MNIANIGQHGSDTCEEEHGGENVSSPQETDAGCVTHEPMTVNNTTVCRVCHRVLTDPASVSQGIGPVCASGNGGGGRHSGGGSSVLQQIHESAAAFGAWTNVVGALQILARLEQPYDMALTMSLDEAKTIETMVLRAQSNLYEFVKAWQHQRQHPPVAVKED
jgi:hypothetical protein